MTREHRDGRRRHALQLVRDRLAVQRPARLACLLILALSVHATAPAQERPSLSAKEVAITFDDLPLNGLEIGVPALRAMTEKLLGVIRAHRIPAVGFVNEIQLYRPGEMDERFAILKLWLDHGIELGNHTYSHPSLKKTPLAAFEEDVIRGETVTRILLEAYGLRLRYFRHPYLETGATLETRAALEDFLAKRGYIVAPVTLVNSDWMFNTVYVNARRQGDEALMKRVGAAYLEHIRAMVGYYEEVALAVTGAPMRHIMLLHATPLNADYFDAAARILSERGYRFVTLERALEDPAYRLPDQYASQMGASWLFHWAYTKGMKGPIGEDPVPPAFIRELYNEAKAGRGTAPRPN